MKGRREGTIKSWNDARGFGFIAPAEGGRAVFAHISAFESGRPRMAQRVRFVAETSADGRLRASKVQLLDVALPPASERIRAATGLDRTSQLVLALLVACLAAAIGLGGLPWWIALVYGGLSGLTFLVYAADKSSARAGARRISESTLHLLALAGGWPGALVAQQVLRHKSSKTSFLAVYWATVALNCAGCALLALPAGRAWLWSWAQALP